MAAYTGGDVNAWFTGQQALNPTLYQQVYDQYKKDNMHFYPNGFGSADVAAQFENNAKARAANAVEDFLNPPKPEPSYVGIDPISAIIPGGLLPPTPTDQAPSTPLGPVTSIGSGNTGGNIPSDSFVIKNNNIRAQQPGGQASGAVSLGLGDITNSIMKQLANSALANTTQGNKKAAGGFYGSDFSPASNGIIGSGMKIYN